MGFIVTRDLLDYYRKSKREIPILELELADMQQGQNGFGNSTVFDYRNGYPRPQSVIGFDWPLYERRKKILINKKVKCKVIEGWIQNIDDGQTRCVFKMYYQDGLTWEQIARKIGYGGNSDYPRLHIRDKYLKDNNIL